MEESVEAYDALRPEGYQKADIRDYNQAVADISIQMAMFNNVDEFKSSCTCNTCLYTIIFGVRSRPT